MTTRRCVLCGEDIEYHAYLDYQWVQGFTRERDAGGTHGLTLRKVLGYAHGECVTRTKRGIAPLQESLF